MKKLFLLPFLFVCSLSFSQTIKMQVSGMAESGNGIEILSFSWGVSNPMVIGSVSGGAGTGKANFTSFNLLKNNDKTSLRIIEAITKGVHYPEIIITITDDKGKPTFRYKLTTVFFESIQQSSCADKACSVINESISIAAGKWGWEDLVNNTSYQFDRTTNTSN